MSHLQREVVSLDVLHVLCKLTQYLARVVAGWHAAGLLAVGGLLPGASAVRCPRGGQDASVDVLRQLRLHVAHRNAAALAGQVVHVPDAVVVRVLAETLIPLALLPGLRVHI